MYNRLPQTSRLLRSAQQSMLRRWISVAYHMRVSTDPQILGSTGAPIRGFRGTVERPGAGSPRDICLGATQAHTTHPKSNCETASAWIRWTRTLQLCKPRSRAFAFRHANACLLFSTQADSMETGSDEVVASIYKPKYTNLSTYSNTYPAH